MKEFLMANWPSILAGLVPVVWAIVRLTPTEKDDKIWGFIVKVIEAIPDMKKGGGKHESKISRKNRRK